MYNDNEKTYGLDAVMDETRDIKVAFIGGSITQGGNYTKPFIEKWQAERAGVITTINAGVGGTGSNYGALRFYDEVLKRKPDIVFVEFTLNDELFQESIVKKSIESLIRQAYISDHQPVISFIYIPDRRIVDGVYKIADDVRYYDEVLGYYGLKGINAHQIVLDAVSAKTHVWDDFVPENDVHPNSVQGENIADLIYNEFKKNNYENYVKNIEWNPIKGFNAQDYKKPGPVSSLKGSYDSAWSDSKPNDVVTEGYGVPTTMPFDNFMATSKVGATMSFSFSGRTLGITTLFGKKGRAAHYTISNAEGVIEKSGTMSNFIAKYDWYKNIMIIIDDLEDSAHTLKITVEDGEGLFGIGQIWVDE
jgi:hypothetical protein